MKSAIYGWAIGLSLMFLNIKATAGTATIPATADLFSAGQSTADATRGGTLPFEIDLSPGGNRSIQFTNGTGTVVALLYFQFANEWMVTAWASVVFFL